MDQPHPNFIPKLKDLSIQELDAEAEKQLELKLVPMPFRNNISGCEGFLSSNLDEIIYYEHPTNEARTRFTIAHEIGHLVLHANYIKQLMITDFNKWVATILTLDTAVWSRAEFQANRFATFLLVPISELMQEITTFKPQLEKAYNSGIKHPAEIYEYLAPGLARTFLVSEEMMKHHLSNNAIDPFSIL